MYRFTIIGIVVSTYLNLNNQKSVFFLFFKIMNRNITVGLSGQAKQNLHFNSINKLQNEQKTVNKFFGNIFFCFRIITEKPKRLLIWLSFDKFSFDVILMTKIFNYL